MNIISIDKYVKKHSGGNSFFQMSEVNKIKYLVDYLNDIIEYFDSRIEKLESKNKE